MRKVSLSLFSILGFLIFAIQSPTAIADMMRSAVITDMQGQVMYLSSDTGEWLPASLGITLKEKDTVKTLDDGTCTLLFKGMADATAEIRPKGVMEVKGVNTADAGDNTELELTLGSVLVKAEKLQGESEFQVRTPNSIVGIRGTESEVSVE